MIFVFLRLPYFTQYVNLYVHPCCCKWHYFIHFNDWATFQCVYICIHIFFIHLPGEGHLGCFHVLAIVNSAAMNIGVHVSFQSMVFLSRCMPWSGSAESYDSSVFSFLRSLHTVLPIVHTDLRAYRQCSRVPFFHTFSSIYYLKTFGW